MMTILALIAVYFIFKFIRWRMKISLAEHQRQTLIWIEREKERREWFEHLGDRRNSQ